MKKYNKWYDYYQDNIASDEYKAYAENRKRILYNAYMDELANNADNMGNDLAAFTNEVINGISIIDNQVVFTGKMKETKTYSIKFAELLGRELGKELGKIPFMLLDDKRKNKQH